MNERTRLYLLSTLVGILTGVVGGGFHWLLSRIATHRLDWIGAAAGVLHVPDWIAGAVLGAAAITLSRLLIVRFAPEAAGSGIQEIEGNLAGVRPMRWARVLPVKFSAGLLSVGAGLVLGREGPTIHMGGALGRMLAELRELSLHASRTLVAAGSGAGLAVAFNAPFSGIVFVTEEMREQFEYSFISLHCVILACLLGVTVSGAICGQGPDLLLPMMSAPPVWEMPLFLLLGVAIGAIGVLFNATLLGGLSVAGVLRRRGEPIVAPCIGAGFGLLVCLAPRTASGGEQLVIDLVTNPITLGALALLLLARYATSIVSYSAGVPGGIFAPMLALGTLMGLLFGKGLHWAAPSLETQPGAFAVAAMGALFAATVRAPLTGIALVLELTGNHELTLATVGTCVTASLTAQRLGGQPIYRLLLERAPSLDTARDRRRAAGDHARAGAHDGDETRAD